LKKTRAEKAGRLMAWALIEMVHLMYQKNTALNFLKGLTKKINSELNRRQKEKGG